MGDSTLYRYNGNGTSPTGTGSQSRDPSGSYLADPKLVIAVNTALLVEQPLLVTGEPGTGKTALAWSIATELGLGPPLTFFTRSDHQARDVLYSFDHLRRYYHAQINDPQAADPRNYVTFQALGDAIRQKAQRVVLIDEIDKAPRDFPNDLLNEIDRMEFWVRETGEHFAAAVRPIVVITSNSERQLPDPFLRRCVFHHIRFPDATQLRQILTQRLADLRPDDRLIEAAIRRLQELRAIEELEKKPGTGELIPWIRVLVRAGVDPQKLLTTPLAELDYINALLKTRQDLELIQKSG